MVQLKELRPWEKISFVIKRHWIVFLMLGFYFLWWLTLTIILFVLFWFHIAVNLIVIIFWMFFALFLYIEWLNHELDMYVVTNNRIIFIEQKSFLDRAKTECNLWQVQEVNSNTKWLFANLLWYWNLSVVTAWSTQNLDMWFAPDSLWQARKILNIVDVYRDSHSFRQKEESETT